MIKRFQFAISALAVVLDALAILAAMIVAYRWRAEGLEIYFWPIDRYLQFVIYLLPVWLFLLASQGMYNLRELPRAWSALAKIFFSILSGWGVMIITLFLWKSPAAQVFPRLVVAYGLFTTVTFTFIGRYILGWLLNLARRSGIAIYRTVIVTNQPNSVFCSQLKANYRLGRKVVEIIGVEKLGRLDELAASKAIDEIIVDEPQLDDEELLNLMRLAEMQGIAFTLVPTLLSVRSSNVEFTSLAGKPVMHFKRTPLEGPQRVIKRLFDLLCSLLAIIILLPILLLLSLLVLLGSRGSIIYRQPRVGQDGQLFYVHKFRSMYRDADERFKQFGGWSTDEKKDPRVTPIGRLLRATNLDELPQLFDILLGSMSIVGPRPEQPQYVEKFAKEIPNYLRRHHVKTGLTGWAQINGLRGDTSISERVKYDLYYIENWSIWFDLRIIASTFIYMLRELVKR